MESERSKGAREDRNRIAGEFERTIGHDGRSEERAWTPLPAHNVAGHRLSIVTVLEVTMFHMRDGLAENGKIDTRRLNPICRLGGPNYASVGEIVTMPAIRVTTKE